MNTRARMVWLISVAVVVHAACAPEDDTGAGQSGVECSTLNQMDCAGQVGCTWSGSACIASDAGGADAPECTLPACPGPKCGQIWSDAGFVCIARPDCSGLSAAACGATLGCRSIAGRLPGDAGGPQFVGCGDGIDSPWSAITCTASGPSGDCWVLPDTAVPSGWKGWPCADPKSRAECMEQGPYGTG